MTAQEKLEILQKVLKEGASVSSVCRQEGISRKTFYAWKKKYLTAPARKKLASLKKGHLKGADHPRGRRYLYRNDILRLVAAYPEWGSRRLRQALVKKGKHLSNHAVYSLLADLNLCKYRQRYEFSRLHRTLSQVRDIYSPGPKRLISRARKQMVEEVVLAGRKVGEVANEFKVSRKTVWKWTRRYHEAKAQEVAFLLALKDQHPTGSCHPRGTPEWLEKKILDQVIAHPEYSVHALARVFEKQIGHHGIQNVLYRNGLNTFEKRKLYAQTQAPVLVTPVTAWLDRLKIVWEQFIPTLAPAPPPIRRVSRRARGFAKIFLASSLTAIFFSFFFLFFLQITSGQPTSTKIGLFFAMIALTVGSFFFAYSMKYYFTLALVLSFSRQPGEGVGVGLAGEIKKGGNGRARGLIARIFGWGNGPPAGGLDGEEVRAPGLTPSLEHVKLKRYPFVSIHLPFYNERRVADRILSACTSFDYPNYEVIVCDDSTDETVKIVKKWEKHPKVKVLHRPTREGFKGGALSYAVKHMNPKTEFVIVLDADFVPYPDTIEQFLRYFKASGGWSEERNYQAGRIVTMPYETFEKVRTGPKLKKELALQEKELLKASPIACVAGYQWHVLNKSENWITRGVRAEYAGSYVIERPGQEILGALKIIHGSVYMLRADILKHFGWGVSITEDFELTLRIYEKGFKVAYTPYIQAPSECVATVKRLVRQRMRWAEGHSFNVRKMGTRLLSSSNLSLMEKLEFLYISPYYLQAFFFVVGTFSWLISETVFRARLPFWTSLWGWSLVLTNFFALPLLNGVGLFLEEAEEKDYLGLISFIFLSYLVVPFQAYSSVKGFVGKKEGPWFRTPKTGKITDIFTRGRFYRWISGILPGRRPTPIVAEKRGWHGREILT